MDGLTDGQADEQTNERSCIMLLVYSASSVLKTETFRCLEESVNLDEFLRANTGGCNALMLPTMLGLRLAEDFELGTRSYNILYFTQLSPSRSVFCVSVYSLV